MIYSHINHLWSQVQVTLLILTADLVFSDQGPPLLIISWYFTRGTVYTVVKSSRVICFSCQNNFEKKKKCKSLIWNVPESENHFKKIYKAVSCSRLRRKLNWQQRTEIGAENSTRNRFEGWKHKEKQKKEEKACKQSSLEIASVKWENIENQITIPWLKW